MAIDALYGDCVKCHNTFSSPFLVSKNGKLYCKNCIRELDDEKASSGIPRKEREFKRFLRGGR